MNDCDGCCKVNYAKGVANYALRSKLRIYEVSPLKTEGTTLREASESQGAIHMPVLEQITEQITDASDKFFDAAESANERAHGATKNMVTRIQDGDLPFAERFSAIEVPFADRLPEVNLPLVDKLPEPLEAVDAYFGFWSKGIETNRAFAEKVMSRFAEVEVPEVKTAPVKKATPAKKTTARKTTAKKTPAKKTTKKVAAKKA